jgi:predicted DNA-binding protein YlxM (UPF0122 family)
MGKKQSSPVPAVVPSDKFSISELAGIFGFPVSALVDAINRNRQAVKKPYYSIPDLAARWNCSRATVYNVLRESESKLFNMSRKGRGKGKWNVPAAVVERIEQSRMEPIPESVAG